ncbi:unnamed protein product [Orchesella dallaii]|uniref:Integrase catalytic domain-containing protein n=1 Tax=Orchesella dallaii TaxID=48710 RepID=A0ABP1PPY3_9HEXA
MAYGAIVYLKIIDNNNQVHVSFITSKSKVSPLKQITLPRLELCAAVVLSKLMCYLRSALKLQYEEYCWTDSTIVLRWISATPKKWKNFIANRVAVVQSNTTVESWRHVPGIQNPADIASRGCAAADLINNSMWWQGPPWLQSIQVPVFIPNEFNPCIDAEERKVNFITTMTITTEQPYYNNVSSLIKLKRITAYCIRFISNARKQPLHGPLSTMELRKAYHVLIKMVQKSNFAAEIKSLQSNLPVSSSSRLKTLHPFLDNEGILCVGGRLQNADIPENKKHQMILPHDNHVTKLLIRHTHVSLLHGGFQVTWSTLQSEYWILRGRDTVRFYIRKCVICKRQQARNAAQLMGNLPSPRITITRPFLNVGIDYAGPFMLRNMVGRNSKVYKGYLAIFVCLSTKAVHMEAVSDLSTEAFIASLRRFVARRGLCANIHSDHGTNFVGADAELKRLFSSSDHNSKVADYLSSQRMMWHFIPPSAPHHGGIWEAAVKSAKYHFKRVMGNSLCTFEKFQTVLCQVEAVMNSRPLCPLSTDPSDLNALTPGHFIIGEPLTALPDENVSTLKTNRLSMWQQLQQRIQHFWQRWRDEYLVTLQQRHKWFRKEENVKIDDLVIIKEDNSPPGKWKLARVINVQPGTDGQVRVATVKTATSEYQRPIVKLIPLLSQ